MKPPHSQTAKRSIALSIPKEGRHFELGEHFTLREFACRDGTPVVLVHNVLIQHLDRMRGHFGVPVYVHSGFRTAAHNADEGGVDNSTHLWGGAADVRVEDVPPSDVASWAEDEGFGGVGRYDSFTHVDVKGKGRRWDNT